MKFELYQAKPHQWGAGKVHALDPEDEDRTFCGKHVDVTPGTRLGAGSTKEVTCRSCLTAIANREDRIKRQAEWAALEQERKAAAARENEEWRTRYNVYLQSAQWRTIRSRVLDRAKGMCEGCGVEKAVQVHHLTYRHVCEEFLWELRAVCLKCHERLHHGGSK